MIYTLVKIKIKNCNKIFKDGLDEGEVGRIEYTHEYDNVKKIPAMELVRLGEETMYEFISIETVSSKTPFS